MTRPAAVVYIEGTQGAAREEAAWAVRWLRRDFSVALARDWDGLERRIDESVRIALVLGSHVPEPRARTRGLPSRSRMILAVPAEVRNEMALRGFPAEGAAWIEPGHARELLPRLVSAGLVQGLFARCRSALGTFQPLLGDAHLLEMLKVALAPRPARPFGSVNEMAAVTHRSRRWLNLSWTRMAQGVAAPVPDLKDLVRGILFLRALGLWLSGAPMEVCASVLETPLRTLEELFSTFLGAGSRQIDCEALPPKLLRIEQELFGWLLPVGPKKPAGHGG